MPRFSSHLLTETAAAFAARARELDSAPDQGRAQLTLLGRALKPDIRASLVEAIDGGELHLSDPNCVVYDALRDPGVIADESHALSRQYDRNRARRAA